MPPEERARARRGVPRRRRDGRRSGPLRAPAARRCVDRPTASAWAMSGVRSRSIEPASTARSATSRWSTPRASRGRRLPRAVARAPGCQGEPRAHERRWDLAGTGCGVAPGVVSNVEGGRGTRSEGRSAPRQLRPDHRRREEDRSVRLTPSAYAHGYALALPEKVAVARPTGAGHAIAVYDTPFEGRDEWLASAVRRFA